MSDPTNLCPSRYAVRSQERSFIAVQDDEETRLWMVKVPVALDQTRRCRHDTDNQRAAN